MTVTVVICTWNRAELLDRTLAQFKMLELPPHLRWELLVVNNRCTDDTDKVISRYDGALPIRRLYEDEPGKSHAANRAIDEAKGDLLVWTDDDVLVQPNWLVAYVKAAAAYPDVSVFGGTILPWFEHRAPDWITRHLDRWLHGCYAIRSPNKWRH